MAIGLVHWAGNGCLEESLEIHRLSFNLIPGAESGCPCASEMVNHGTEATQRGMGQDRSS